MKQSRPGTVTTGPHHESRAKASQFHTHGSVWHGSTEMSRHIAKPDHTGRTLGDMTEGRSRRAAERKVYHATFGSLAWVRN